MRKSTAAVLERATFIVTAALVLALIWLLFDVILIVMGAVLVAVLLRLGAEPFAQRLRLPEAFALGLSGIAVIGILGSAGYFFGSHIEAEFQDVLQRTNATQKVISSALQGNELGRLMLSHIAGSDLSVTDILTKLFRVSASFIEAVIITIIAGIYLAIQPSLYRAGLVKLFPRRWRENAGETVDDIGNALRLWLLGQLIQMLLIGMLSAFAAWLIGLPSPLALGLIAAIAEFVPYIGPIVAAVPALLVAATKTLDAVLWTAAAYIIIHQVEGTLIVPLLQRRMVSIPPAIVLLSIITISFVFGTVAIIFAVPIAVTLFVMVKKLYVRDSLGEATSIPGEPQ